MVIRKPAFTAIHLFNPTSSWRDVQLVLRASLTNMRRFQCNLAIITANTLVSHQMRNVTVVGGGVNANSTEMAPL